MLIWKKELGNLVDTINLLATQLRDSNLEKLITQVFQDEHKARSQRIVIRSFRSSRPHLKRNERKLLDAEAQLRKSNNELRFSKTLKKFYGRIGTMKCGKDLW